MASVDDTVRRSILTFPGLYTSRTEVLVDLLCSVGNGWRWKNGEPQYWGDDYPQPWTPESYDADLQDTLRRLPADMVQEIRDSPLHEQRKTKYTTIISEIDERVNLWDEQGYSERSLHPAEASYFLLNKMPKNVTPDWRKACEQVRALAAN